MIPSKELDIPISNNLRLLIFPSQKEARCFELADAESFGESKWQLQEGREYEFQFVDKEKNEVKAWFSDDSPADIIKTSKFQKNRGYIRTGLYVGSLKLSIYDDEKKREEEIELEIQSTKTSYRSDYRTMLADITNNYVDLVMSQSSPVALKFKVNEEADSQTLYQKFAFIKSMLENDTFGEALNKIQQNPVMTWKEQTEEKRIENAGRIKNKELRQLLTQKNRIPYSDHPYLTSLPRTINVSRKYDSLDSNENRFVKHALSSFYTFCQDIKSKPQASEKLKKEAEIVCQNLLNHLKTPFFRDIEKPVHINFNSPILQHKEGYREVLQTWIFFELAALLNWEGGENVYNAGMKNVAVLYEYWVFFKLLDIVTSIFNIKIKDKSKLVVADNDNLNLDLKQGHMKMVNGTNESSSRHLNVALYYNRTFSHSKDIHSSGSWTMPMRPDYTLSIWPAELDEREAEQEDLIVHIHFDAKYRVNNLKLKYLENLEPSEEEIQEEKRLEEMGIYKRADILKMHVYKDAIRRTSGAYILYPGDKSIARQGFHEIIPGLGAFCLNPGKFDSQSQELKNFILKVSDHLQNRISQREEMAFQSYRIYKNEPNDKSLNEPFPEFTGDNRRILFDSTNVIIGYVKDDIHKKWIEEKGLYNGRLGKRKGSLTINKDLIEAKYLLLYDGKGYTSFRKIKGEGPKIYNSSDMAEKEYIPKKEDYSYLVFSHEKANEFRMYSWDEDEIDKLIAAKVSSKNDIFKPIVVPLKEIMKLARKIEL
ncbi:MAG: DUF2357 domain-containing protein [Muribaculaceae bacterium]|nr:DUF2357 domain-containing protein [Muribaculaceae bacterium]